MHASNLNTIIAITTGEPAGIGPEISLKAALYYQKNMHNALSLVLIGCKQYLYQIGLACGISLEELNTLHIHNIPCFEQPKISELNVKNSAYVLKTLNAAIQGCLSKSYTSMVTAPIHKGIINTYFQTANLSENTNTHIVFRGHTEYLAEQSHTDKVMMLLSGIDTHRNRRLRVALATTHIPLNEVCRKLNKQKIYDDICFLHQHLHNTFKINNPCIKVAGINPHAGENGHIGNEENIWMKDIITYLRNYNGINVHGPYAGDTLFLQTADCYYCMYHDQGLAPFKYATFGHGVNITLGLPFIRTSVDHGTALDIAPKYCAEIDSMLQAIEKAKQLI
jgi:4-hydroxythreonine-4-phosphate dehydrogenase